jgi:two-component system response regulator FlrC
MFDDAHMHSPIVYREEINSPALQGPLSPEQDQASPQVMGRISEDELQALLPAQLGAGNLHTAVKSNEHQLILAAIQSTESRIEAARQLGISPRTLRYKLAKLKGGQDAPLMSLAR